MLAARSVFDLAVSRVSLWVSCIGKLIRIVHNVKCFFQDFLHTLIVNQKKTFFQSAGNLKSCIGIITPRITESPHLQKPKTVECCLYLL